MQLASEIREIGVALICIGLAAIILVGVTDWPHRIDYFGPLHALQRMGIGGPSVWVAPGLALLFLVRRANPKFRIFLKIVAWYVLTYPALCIGDFLLSPSLTFSIGSIILHGGVVLYISTTRLRSDELPETTSLPEMKNVLQFKRFQQREKS